VRLHRMLKSQIVLSFYYDEGYTDRTALSGSSGQGGQLHPRTRAALPTSTTGTKAKVSVA
jgi:hypothetical protein